jgi:hypothetical protein
LSSVIPPPILQIADKWFSASCRAQAALHTVEDQRAVITESLKVLSDYCGKAPKGWLGPGLHETLDTLDHLAEAGFRFVCDWPLDEQPVTMKTSSHPVVAMPYNLELSDLPMMVVHQHESQAWLQRAIDHFDWVSSCRRSGSPRCWPKSSPWGASPGVC